MCERYNGHANYPTWAVVLWLDNEPVSYEATRASARAALELVPDEEPRGQRIAGATAILASELRSDHELAMDDVLRTQNGFSNDLATWALEQVDWYEIAESYITEELDG